METAKHQAKQAHSIHFNPIHPWMVTCDTLQIEPGDELRDECHTLPGGAYLIAASRINNHVDDRHLWVFLCALETSKGVEFVTWRANDGRAGGVPSCYLRNDYDSLSDAVDGFHKRASR